MRVLELLEPYVHHIHDVLFCFIDDSLVAYVVLLNLIKHFLANFLLNNNLVPLHHLLVVKTQLVQH